MFIVNGIVTDKPCGEAISLSARENLKAYDTCFVRNNEL